MKKAPKTRFIPFQEDWANKRFADAFTVLPNNTLSRAELSDEAGTVKNVHYGDVLIKYGEYLDAGKTDIPFIASEDLAERWKSAALQDGDVVMADTAEDTTAGKCSEIGNVRSDTIVSGLHTIPLHPQSKFSEGYLGYYMNSDAFHDQLIPLMQGTKVTSISKSYLADTELRFPPDSAEQAQIAQLLYSLDQMITSQQRKCDKLIALKAASLDKMFPKKGSKVPELRFARFDGDWEQRKAKELCNIGTGKSNTQDQAEDGIYPFYIRSDIPVKSNKYLYDCEAVITIGDGNIGRVFHYVNGKFDLHQRCYKMTDFQGIWGKYYYYFFSSRFLDRAMKMTAKATVDSVRLEMISEMDILKPIQIDEQKMIADFLTNLDNLITLQQRKLEKLQQFKQAMMHNMFV